MDNLILLSTVVLGILFIVIKRCCAKEVEITDVVIYILTANGIITSAMLLGRLFFPDIKIAPYLENLYNAIAYIIVLFYYFDYCRRNLFSKKQIKSSQHNLASQAALSPTTGGNEGNT